MGSGASSIPMGDALDINQVKELVGEEYYQEVYDRYKRADGTVAVDKLVELSAIETDVFLSHDWGKDSQNHNRVAKFNEYLISKGVKTWFDADKMRGDIVKKMCNGIDKTKCIVVFVTDNYIKKVDSTNFNDNCQLEFKYSMRQKSGGLMVPVCMEPEMSNALKWKGPVGMVLGGTIYISAINDSNFEQACQDLYDAIKKCINDNYPSCLQIGNIVKKSKAPTYIDESAEAQPTVVVTKYDADEVYKNIRGAVGNFTKKTIPENSAEIAKKALNDLLEAMNEGPHRQYDFAENGTCEIIAKFFKILVDNVESTDSELLKLAMQCIINLSAYRESDVEPFVCNSENIASFISSGTCSNICKLIPNVTTELQSIACYTIASLADDIDACNAFIENESDNIKNITDLCYEAADESHIPLLKNLCCAIARLNAFNDDEMKEIFCKTGFIRNLAKAWTEVGSQDDDFSILFCKAVGSLCCDKVIMVEDGCDKDGDVIYKRMKVEVDDVEVDDDGNVCELEDYCYIRDIGNACFRDNTCIIDIIKEVGINNEKAAAAAADALARVMGVRECYSRGLSTENIACGSDCISAIIESKIEVQLLKILKKFQDNENVAIGICRSLVGLLRCEETKLQSMKKLNLFPILTDIIKSLGVKPINFVKDEVVALYAINLLEYCKLGSDETTATGLVSVVYNLATRFCDSSFPLFWKIHSLVDGYLSCSIEMIKKLVEIGFIELFSNLYFKYRYQEYCSYNFFITLCLELPKKSADMDEVSREQYLEVYEVAKSKCLSAGLKQVYYDMKNKKNLIKLLSVGMDEGEVLGQVSELEDALRECDLLSEDEISLKYVDDDGNKVCTKVDGDYDDESGEFTEVDRSYCGEEA